MHDVCPTDGFADNVKVHFGKLESVRMDQVVKNGNFELLEYKFIGGGVSSSKYFYFVAMLAEYSCESLCRYTGAVVGRVIGVNNEENFHRI